jgi:O-antigen ligase
MNSPLDQAETALTDRRAASRLRFSLSPALKNSLSLRLENVAFWLLIVALAWTPFPIGSNRGWSWSLLALIVAAAWLVWLSSVWQRPGLIRRQARPLTIPLLLAAAALAWGVVQIIPVVPAGWAHPVWSMASSALRKSLPATISLDPWRTETELMKLSSYAMMAWLFYSMARDSARARLLFDAITAIGFFYVAYAWIFAFMDWHQFQLFYSGPDIGNRMAAPFVNRNSLATYAGIISLCCGVRLVDEASKSLVRGRGLGRLALSGIQFSFGHGTTTLIAALMSFSLVIATGSLGGTLATLTAIIVMFALSAAVRMRAKMDTWSALTMAGLVLSIIGLVALNSGELAGRLSGMASTGLAEDMRIDLWHAAERMIGDAPFLGLGLGAFQSAYPLYSQNFYPFVMDKAHNDFLELAAGWGLPAAIAWLGAVAWLAAICVRGVFVRQRDRNIALTALGATILVGVHSLFDFSLQTPAISLLYAAVLGLGVAQAFPSSERRDASNRLR